MASAQATAAPLAALPDFAQDLGHGVYAIDTAFQRDLFDAIDLFDHADAPASFPLSEQRFTTAAQVLDHVLSLKGIQTMSRNIQRVNPDKVKELRDECRAIQDRIAQLAVKTRPYVYSNSRVLVRLDRAYKSLTDADTALEALGHGDNR